MLGPGMPRGTAHQEEERMSCRRRAVPKSASTLAIVTFLCLGLATAVVAQAPPPTPGKEEVTDAGRSWPHEVKAPDQPYGGKSMAVLLTEIHEKALDAWLAAPPEAR